MVSVENSIIMAMITNHDKYESHDRNTREWEDTES